MNKTKKLLQYILEQYTIALTNGVGIMAFYEAKAEIESELGLDRQVSNPELIRELNQFTAQVRGLIQKSYDIDQILEKQKGQILIIAETLYQNK